MKKKVVLCTIILSMLFFFPMTAGELHAEDYSGNEAYYQNLCSSNPKDASCSGFRDYLSNQQEDLLGQVSSMKNDVEAIKGNINAIQDTINQQQKTIDAINALIAENDAAITRIQDQIAVLNVEIKQTEADIKERDETIKGRMISEQVNIGTNVYAEFIMGASDIVDMVRIASGIEQITENDQNEIKALEEDKRKLDEQKEEQNRLKEDQEATRAQNVENKEAVEEALRYQQELQTEYQKQEATLLEQIRSANAAATAIQNKIISIQNVSYTASDGWIRPVNGRVSANTFAYPGGGFHAGEDFAASVGTPIVAPIGGVIVYANNPYGSYSGYLGNYTGHPAGAGNSVHMVGTVAGVTYGISFFHMAQENFAAYAGMAVSQGTFIGGVGHSGNSTGAHAHVEVINLGTMTTDEAIAQFKNSGADFAWGTGWSSTSTSCNARGYAPCREQPERFFGS